MAEFPYETRLNVLHGPLEVIDARQIADECTYKWFNQTLCQVNDSVVRNILMVETAAIVPTGD